MFIYYSYLVIETVLNGYCKIGYTSIFYVLLTVSLDIIV